jgi:hypothetical protein
MKLYEIENELILKEEAVGYLKSRIDLEEATLLMTSTRVMLKVNYRRRPVFSFLRNILGTRKRKEYIFNLQSLEIQSITRKKYGVLNNILEITDMHKNSFRIIVNNYQEWEDALNHILFFKSTRRLYIA